MNRDEFLARVRAAATAGRGFRVHLQAHEHGQYVPSDRQEALARFEREVVMAGGHYHSIESAAALAELLESLIERHACRRAIAWRHPALERLGVRHVLDARGVAWLDAEGVQSLPPAEQRAAWLAAELGITAADYAIAETGSVVVASAPGQERMVSLLPKVHLALVDPECLLADLFDLFARLQAQAPDRLPSNVTLITGPSKTGDLELRLVTGVHGPQAWHVAVIHST